MEKLDLNPVFQHVEILRLSKDNWNHSGLETLFKIRLLKLDDEQAVLSEYSSINEYYNSLHRMFETFFINTCDVLSDSENKFFAGYYTQNIPNNFDYKKHFKAILSAMYKIAFEVFNRFVMSLAQNEQKTVNFMLKIVDTPESLQELNIQLISSQFSNELKQVESILKHEASKLEDILKNN